jgi:hypothetical protein
MDYLFFVIPVEAGIQSFEERFFCWIPAFAGMTCNPVARLLYQPRNDNTT